MPGDRDELEDYLRETTQDPAFRAAYERQFRSDPWRMAEGAVEDALALIGGHLAQFAEGGANFLRAVFGSRGFRIFALALLAVTWTWIIVMLALS